MKNNSIFREVLRCLDSSPGLGRAFASYFYCRLEVKISWVDVSGTDIAGESISAVEDADKVISELSLEFT